MTTDRAASRSKSSFTLYSLLCTRLARVLPRAIHPVSITCRAQSCLSPFAVPSLARNMNKELCVKLIQLYGSYRLLWDPRCPEYTNKRLREDAWRNISREINLPVLDLRKKMESLMGSYRREKSRERKSRVRRAGITDRYKSRWFAYTAFEFLQGKNKPQDRQNTEPSATTESDLQVEPEVAAEKSGGDITHPRPMKRPRQDGGRLHPTPEDPQVKSFCAYLAAKLLSYSPVTRVRVQHAFYDILSKADRGLFESLTNGNQPDKPTTSHQISHSTPVQEQSQLQHSSIHPMETVLPVSSISSPLDSQPSSSKSFLKLPGDEKILPASGLKDQYQELYGTTSDDAVAEDPLSSRQEDEPLEPFIVDCKSEIVEEEEPIYESEDAASSVHSSIGKHSVEYQNPRTSKRAKPSDYNEESEEYDKRPEEVSVKQERDRFDVFGELVAYKLRHLSTDYAKNTVEHLISSLLYDASTGKYDSPDQKNS